MSTFNQHEFRFGFSREGLTYSVQAIIMVNVLVFVLQLLLDVPFGNAVFFDAPGGELFLEVFGYSTTRVLQGWIWTPATYMFVHAGLQHLFFNMLLLFFFGPDVERLLGTRQFLRFYFLCGIVGVLVNMLTLALGGPAVAVIGASGAIMGVVVAFAVVDPDRQIFLFPLPFPITARAMVIIFIVLDLLSVASGGRGTSVATHLGGMAVGFLYMRYRPLLLQWTLRHRRRPKSPRNSRDPEGPSKEKQESLAKAVDNIFKFQGKDRK